MSLGEESLQEEREEEEEEEAAEDLQLSPHPAGQWPPSLCSHADAHLGLLTTLNSTVVDFCLLDSN